jgi:hypothetical protein
MKLNIQSVVSAFGATAKTKLANLAASGQPENQLRAPFEHLLAQLAELCNLPQGSVVAVGESSVSDLKTRPDYAVTVHNALAGFVELKAPGKGADPRKFKDPHDKAQWEKLRSLPNLLYTDGNAFSLWQNGELVGSVMALIGDIQSSGNKLEAPTGLLGLFENFFQWEPIPPLSAKELAQSTARLCRLLRDEVTEQLVAKQAPATPLAQGMNKLGEHFLAGAGFAEDENRCSDRRDMRCTLGELSHGRMLHYQSNALECRVDKGEWIVFA